MSDPEPEFLSVEAFSKRTGLSLPTVRRMLSEHRLAATKTSPGRGGSWLIPTSEVERLHTEAQAWRYKPEDGEDQ